MSHFQITIKGIVQGVGFRPTVYNIARKLELKGFVTNTSEGVIAEVEGEKADRFADTLREEIPQLAPLAKIVSIESKELPHAGYTEFAIIKSIDNGGFTHISPDISICDDCLNELLDPSDRRYQYPFINCTNCGPRYTITKKVPYDRPNTTMAVFPMCPRCEAEYNDPANRRFHAQPNACPICGPQVHLQITNSRFRADEKDPIASAIELLKQGAIVAVKGLGGFHLCCDAENEKAVDLLRERKKRRNKPFALMSADVETIRSFCEISAEEEKALRDMRRPIVLLKRKSGPILPDGISPRNRYLGFMLPYTPLHYLLFNYRKNRGNNEQPHFRALVATSGNFSEEPIVIDNGEAVEKLGSLADAFLMHNRDIFMRVDDSVVRINNGRMLFIRRSRGYAPEAIMLDEEGPDVLGCGAEVKNTFAITKGNAAIVSQHIGDMENVETLAFFEETLNNLKQVYRSRPLAVGYDLHPGYLSTRWAAKHVAEKGLKGYGLQHHYAHIASVMAENRIKEKVLGVALDGTGYGTDGHLWGSEFLVCDLKGFERFGHFRYVPLPGGEMAIREPWRTAVSYIKQSVEDSQVLRHLADIGFVEKYGQARLETILKIMDKPGLSPLSAGAGRLFDAISALAGICDISTYEGEAAVALESALPDDNNLELHSYSYIINETEPAVVDFSGMIREIIDAIKKGTHKKNIALCFHKTMVNVVTEMVCKMRDKTGIQFVALSGGCFQNAALLKGVSEELKYQGLTVLLNENIPCNDACLSLGQAYLIKYMHQ